MRVLFSCTAGDGHFLPLLPLARATAARGDEVAFSTSRHAQSRVLDAGFPCLPAGISVEELERRAAPLREELLKSGLSPMERRVRAFSERFAGMEAPAKLDDLVRIVDEWRPDAVVHESGDLAAPLAAAAAGVRSIHHSFGRTIPAAAVRRAAEVIAPLWQRHGLTPDEWAGMYRGAYVDIWPPSLQGEPPPSGTEVHPLRPVGARDERTERCVVYVTLGTVFNRVEIFRELLDAFSTLDCDIVMTVGPTIDPAALGTVPPNALVKRYLPQADVLPRAHAVVAHGGSGSTLGALAHGCPIVFVPQGADQFENAAAVAGAGAGVAVGQDEQDAETLRASLDRVLGDERFARAARAVAEEMAAMPAPEDVAAALFGG